MAPGSAVGTAGETGSIFCLKRCTLRLRSFALVSSASLFGSDFGAIKHGIYLLSNERTIARSSPLRSRDKSRNAFTAVTQDNKVYMNVD